MNINIKKWSDIKTEIERLRAEVASMRELNAKLVSNSAFSWRVRALTTVQRDALYPTPFDCLMVYNTTLTLFQLYYNGAWNNVGAAGAIDHGADLAGLGDDDHAQYLLLAGRGGQNINDIITLSNITMLRGDAFAGPTAYVYLNTIDGNDAGKLVLCGGGDVGNSRGASITLYGNENSGRIYIETGNVDTRGIFVLQLKTGATQVAAGAAAQELWATSGHASLPDGVVMRGV